MLGIEEFHNSWSNTDDYFEKIMFCHPDQSQRDVDCIPLPKNMTYDKVHD